MTDISNAEFAEPLNDRACSRLAFATQGWSGRGLESLPGLMLNLMVAGVALGIRQLPGMTSFSPMILSIIIGIAFHNIVGTAAWAKQGVTFSLRWLFRFAIILLGLQLTASQVIEIGGRGLGIVVATVLATFGFTVWMGGLLGVQPKLAQRIAAGTSICGASAVIATNTVTKAYDEDVAYAVACVTVAATTFLLSVALAAMGLETDIGKLAAKGFRPALLGAFAFMFIAGFSLTLIKLTG
jgi:uncharacterized membrane protein YadS